MFYQLYRKSPPPIYLEMPVTPPPFVSCHILDVFRTRLWHFPYSASPGITTSLTMKSNILPFLPNKVFVCYHRYLPRNRASLVSPHKSVFFFVFLSVILPYPHNLYYPYHSAESYGCTKVILLQSVHTY